MRCVLGIVVHGMWIELCVGVGTPHVSGVGGLGEFGRDLLCLCGVDADELAFVGVHHSTQKGMAVFALEWCCQKLLDSSRRNFKFKC